VTHEKPQVSRRGLLSGAARTRAALPLASACKSVGSVPGELRGGAMALGHELRSASLEQASAEAERVGIAIVGAGPSGLSAAWRLERLGYRDFVVLELEARAGGTASYGTDGVVPYPWGAHYVPVPTAENHGLVALLDEIGVLGRDEHGGVRGQERWLVRQPEERVFAGGRWHEGLFPSALAGPEDLAELRRFEAEMSRLSGWRDARGRRAFALPMWASSDDAEVTAYDRISAAAWLDQHHFHSPLLRWYVEYACRDDYGSSLSRTSAWAMLFYFCARVPGPGQGSAPFLSWPEGNGRLVAHLGRVAGERLRTGALVTDVRPSEGGVELALLDARTRQLSRLRASSAILATPTFVSARLVRPWRDARPQFLDEFQFAPWWVANIHLKERPASKGFPFAWDNVLYDSPSVGYVVATHQALRDRGPSIWTYYRPLWEEEPKAMRGKLTELTQAAAATEVMNDLARAHRSLRAAIERIDVWRWGHARIAPAPGFLFGAARRKAAQSLGALHFAHSDLSGIPLFEEAQARGVVAAEAALRPLGREVPALYGAPA
jgi:phytoene dehydrogenase-like protein